MAKKWIDGDMRFSSAVRNGMGKYSTRKEYETEYYKSFTKVRKKAEKNFAIFFWTVLIASFVGWLWAHFS